MVVTPWSRRLWTLVEPVHATVYFAPEVAAAAAAVGVDRSALYVTSRAAPMGAVTADTATAAFHGFARHRIAATVPAVWESVSPAEVVTARREGMRVALGRILVDVDLAHVGRVANLATEAARFVGDTAGRPLAASNLALLDLLEGAVDRLWQAATVLREHRGEGHQFALAHAEVTPLAAHLIRAAAGDADLAFLQRTRGWSDEEIGETRQDLLSRGWLQTDGALTEAGRSVRQRYEADTDRLASAPWHWLGADRTEVLAELLSPIAELSVAGGGEKLIAGLGSPWPPPASS